MRVASVQLDREVAEHSCNDAKAIGIVFANVAAEGFLHQFRRRATVDV
jgi:hypothetical protein